ncbi:MAG: PH domain-containing protein [Pseudolysinimonas sp.]|uniref:PH domain-containing protein n=1 Tax=Pseudolysinimonas sp. TaxID=2680009 RepID=UPI003265884C
MTPLADGAWHRLHPATPLLRGGIALIAIIGIIVTNLRERLVQWFFPAIACPPRAPECQGDPVDLIVSNGYALIALAIVLALLLVLVALFYVSWRAHTFRVTGEVVEVRSGVLFRTHRKARLDRIQGVTIVRPMFARLLGAARLEVEVAGNDANVQLAYLGTAASDLLRADILRLASGSRAAAGESPAAAGSLLDRRVSELLAPELDPLLAAPESVVRMHPGRLIGSTLLSGTTVVFLVVAIAVSIGLVLSISVSRDFLVLLFTFVPIVLGLGSYLVRRVTRFLRYTIARTPDGVRIGYGLLTTRNDTLPPGRIHSVAVSQNLLWRPAGWWTVRVNRASRGGPSAGQSAQQNTIVLPVGSRADVLRVLELLLPELMGAAPNSAGGVDLRTLLNNGLVGRGGHDEFTGSPRRAVVLRWFSWRRNGFALFPGAVLLRKGAIWRELAIVPTPRMQSVAIEQGPIERALRLAAVHVHTVAGPISPRLGALDARDAEAFFRDAELAAVTAGGSEGTHRWRSGEN